MDADTVELFYEKMGIDIVDIDGYDTLLLDLSDEGDYATISDDDGKFPINLEQPIVVNIYDNNSSHQWSVSLDDSLQFEELFTQAEDTDSLLETLSTIRMENIAKFD